MRGGVRGGAGWRSGGRCGRLGLGSGGRWRTLPPGLKVAEAGTGGEVWVAGAEGEWGLFGEKFPVTCYFPLDCEGEL